MNCFLWELGTHSASHSLFTVPNTQIIISISFFVFHIDTLKFNKVLPIDPFYGDFVELFWSWKI